MITNLKLYDCHNREIKNMIIYGGSVIDSLRTGDINEDIKNFKKGKRPKNGKYYLPEEFFRIFYHTEGAHRSNINYKGVQFLNTVNDGLVWFYYYPIDKLDSFNRLDIVSCSPGICRKVFEMNGFSCILKKEMDKEDIIISTQELYLNIEKNLFYCMQTVEDSDKTYSDVMITECVQFVTPKSFYTWEYENSPSNRYIKRLFWADEYVFNMDDIKPFSNTISNILSMFKSKEIALAIKNAYILDSID